MSLRMKFVELASVPGANVSAVCHQFGVSRQTGHKWLRRYREQGYLGLVERSHRPHSAPTATGDDVVAAIVELRDRRPSWGPEKIARVLESKFGDAAPAKSTVARILRKLGMVKRRRSPVPLWVVSASPRVEAKA